MKNIWMIALAATLMLVATWWDTDFSALSQLSAKDILPVLLVTAVIFLVKTGALSALLILIKKFWNRLRK